MDSFLPFRENKTRTNCNRREEEEGGKPGPCCPSGAGRCRALAHLAAGEGHRRCGPRLPGGGAAGTRAIGWARAAGAQEARGRRPHLRALRPCHELRPGGSPQRDLSGREHCTHHPSAGSRVSGDPSHPLSRPPLACPMARPESGGPVVLGPQLSVPSRSPGRLCKAMQSLRGAEPQPDPSRRSTLTSPSSRATCCSEPRSETGCGAHGATPSP